MTLNWGALLLSLLCVGLGSAQTKPKLQRVPVRPGDTLWSIAQSHLKDPTRWNELLKHNKLSASDPTVALPGTFLYVPVDLIKEELRAAKLVQAMRKVLFRKQETVDWKDSKLGMDLYRGDGLRTLAQSQAQVQFYDGAVLSLDPDSMAILKPPKQEDHDLKLMRGSIHATLARVTTPSARVIPKEKGTQYTAKVLDDLSTRVQVYKGAAAVEGGGKVIEVKGGFYTDVPMDLAPSAPLKIPDMAQLEAEFGELGTPGVGQAPVAVRVSRQQLDAAQAPNADIRADVKKLSIGAPVAAYHLQVSRSESFEKILLEKTYEADSSLDVLANLKESKLPRGEYWVRLAVIDLLGSKSPYSLPRPYRLE